MKAIYILLLFLGFSSAIEKNFYEKLSDAAITLTKDKVLYDPSYFKLKYPNGDVPIDKGVCTDVIIRAYRKLGIDLQKEVHEDMTLHFSKYPKNWNLKNPDSNIDHRRVPNLQTYFSRFGKQLAVSQNTSGYKTGDLVTWLIGEKLPHIGIVTHRLSSNGKRRLIVHNAGNGQVLEDCLFRYKINGHYRFKGK